MLQLRYRLVAKVTSCSSCGTLCDCSESLTPALAVKCRLHRCCVPGREQYQQCRLSRVNVDERGCGQQLRSGDFLIAFLDFESQKPLKMFTVDNNYPGAVEFCPINRRLPAIPPGSPKLGSRFRIHVVLRHPCHELPLLLRAFGSVPHQGLLPESEGREELQKVLHRSRQERFHRCLYCLIEATSHVKNQCSEFVAFYQKKVAEVKIHQHKRALALTARKFV